MKQLARNFIILVLSFFPLVSPAQADVVGNAPFFAHSDESHEIQVMNDGTSAFKSRLELIENSKTFLDLEYFIFDPDHSGRIILQALQKRAQDITRPITIRVLLDYYDAKKDGVVPSIAHILEASGIEVRYFNPVKKINYLKYAHRDHRKLMIADNEDGKLSFCTGGRNLADDYFDLQEKIDFMDRDICVTGPITNSVRESFNLYFANEITHDAADFYNANESKDQEAQEMFVANDADKGLRSKVEAAVLEMGTKPRYKVSSIDFISDTPGRPNGSTRVVQSHFEDFVEKTQKSIRIDNYTYLPKKTLSKKITSLLDAGKEVYILTNSPESNTADRITKLQVRSEISAVRAGAEVYLNSGDQVKDQIDLTLEERGGAPIVWAEHEKSAVRDHIDTAIGTYNIDPRSSNINSEDLVIVYGSEDVARAVESDIDRREKVSHQMSSNGKYSDGGKPDFGPSFKGFVTRMTLPMFQLIQSQY